MAHRSQQFRFEQLHLAQCLAVGKSSKLIDLFDQQDVHHGRSGDVRNEWEDSLPLLGGNHARTLVVPLPAEHQERIHGEEEGAQLPSNRLLCPVVLLLDRWNRDWQATYHPARLSGRRVDICVSRREGCDQCACLLLVHTMQCKSAERFSAVRTRLVSTLHGKEDCATLCPAERQEPLKEQSSNGAGCVSYGQLSTV